MIRWPWTASEQYEDADSSAGLTDRGRSFQSHGGRPHPGGRPAAQVEQGSTTKPDEDRPCLRWPRISAGPAADEDHQPRITSAHVVGPTVIGSGAIQERVGQVGDGVTRPGAHPGDQLVQTGVEHLVAALEQSIGEGEQRSPRGQEQRLLVKLGRRVNTEGKIRCRGVEPGRSGIQVRDDRAGVTATA